MADKKGKQSEKVTGLKKLDVLNSEGPVILATRETGSQDVTLKFDNGKSTKNIALKELIEFIFLGSELVNPSDSNDIYVFANFSNDMRPSLESIENFIKD